jgi:nitrate/nitrite-specific signal transduction histidine kinase
MFASGFVQENGALRARAATMALQLNRAMGSVFLTVKDDGMGFNPRRDFQGHLNRQKGERNNCGYT